ATRYHSLAVVDSTVPPELIVTSRTAGGVIMGMRHESAPIFGVQFHPESVLTEGGYAMIANWLAVAGLPEARETAKGLTPLVNLS
ncbi:MAG TPA: anthranilate synthase component II, partial [Microbacteriaceae bacterium]|nr:anthranilate synthase component II [Microbacteriaceae bacterium]